MLDEDKKIYADYLLTEGESKVCARRFNNRVKLIQEIYSTCDPNTPYEERNNYIESRLESRIGYFDHMDDCN